MTDIGTRALQIFVDSIEFTDSVSTAKITSTETDSDFVSFADAAAGGRRDYAAAIVLKQNVAVDSLWDYAWAHSGEDVEVVIWPNGGAPTPSATTPSFTGDVTIMDPDGDLLGGEANPSNSARMTTEVSWLYLAKPVKAIV